MIFVLTVMWLAVGVLAWANPFFGLIAIICALLTTEAALNKL